MNLTRRSILQAGAAAAAVSAVANGTPAHAAPSPQRDVARPAFRQGFRVRGATINAATILRTDLVALKALGANLVRPSWSAMPFINVDTLAINSTAFERLDQLNAWCQEIGLYHVVNPHYWPGQSDPFTMYPDDAFWKDPVYLEAVSDGWARLAQRCRRLGNVIAGYDLMNEPSNWNPAGEGFGTWNHALRVLVKTIRKVDNSHNVIVEGAIGPKAGTSHWYGRPEAITLLPAPTDPKWVVSPQYYTPFAFTHDFGFPTKYTYPGQIPIDGWEGWPSATYQVDRQFIQRDLAQSARYATKYKVPVYVGEFGAIRWSGASGTRYVSDVVSACEALGYSWSYHSWREWQGWSAEHSPTSRDDETSYPSTPRLEVLKAGWSLNAR